MARMDDDGRAIEESHNSCASQHRQTQLGKRLVFFVHPWHVRLLISRHRHQRSPSCLVHLSHVESHRALFPLQRLSNFSFRFSLPSSRPPSPGGGFYVLHEWQRVRGCPCLHQTGRSHSLCGILGAGRAERGERICPLLRNDSLILWCPNQHVEGTLELR